MDMRPEMMTQPLQEYMTVALLSISARPGRPTSGQLMRKTEPDFPILHLLGFLYLWPSSFLTDKQALGYVHTVLSPLHNCALGMHPLLQR